MKKYEFYFNESYLEKFFIAIRNKANNIEILMETINYMFLNPRISEEKIKWKIVLLVDKMSRLFFISDKKYFSIVFPFFVDYSDGELKFYFKNKIDINNQLTSKVISIIKCDDFKENCSLDFFAPICDYEESCDENFWIFLRELLLMEDWYIRYDYDEESENWNIHPLNHYDLFYSSNVTFKIGLNDKLSEDDFINFLNINTDCKFII